MEKPPIFKTIPLR